MGEVDPQTWGMAIPQYGYIIEALTMGHIGMGTRSPVYNLDMNNLENNCDCLPVLVRVFFPTELGLREIQDGNPPMK